MFLLSYASVTNTITNFFRKVWTLKSTKIVCSKQESRRARVVAFFSSQQIKTLSLRPWQILTSRLSSAFKRLILQESAKIQTACLLGYMEFTALSWRTRSLWLLSWWETQWRRLKGILVSLILKVLSSKGLKRDRLRPRRRLSRTKTYWPWIVRTSG